MGRIHQENTATFAEVFTSSSITCQQSRSAGSHDNRLMLYFQGVKIYIPDGCKQETLLTALSAIRQL